MSSPKKSDEASASADAVIGSGITSEQETGSQQSEPKKISWQKVLELGYESATTEVDSSGGNPATTNNDNSSSCCFKCGKPGATSKCSKCQTICYCSRECQLQNWKSGPGGGHKFLCKYYKRVGPEMKLSTDDDKRTAREDVLTRIRFYACSYAVHKSYDLGKGFLFVQSPSTLAELSLPIPRFPSGNMMPGTRSVLLHYLTLGEFDQEVCRDDFELTSVRSELTEIVDTYNKQEDMVVLMRFRCGHIAIGTAPLVPDFGVCKSLGKEYFGNSDANSLQLNLDDM